MKCWRGQTSIIMWLHNSHMELQNSTYGASLQIMLLYMSYGAPSPFVELHEKLCIKIELHGAPLEHGAFGTTTMFMRLVVIIVL